MKIYLFSILSFLLFSLTASATSNNKILIAYFSRFGNTNYRTNIDATASASIIINENRRIGTTGRMAEIIQENLGGDIHLIKSKQLYPTDFDDVVTQARQERSNDYNPQLVDKIENMNEYGIIFIGYPVWGTTIPAPVKAFLTEYDFTGKTVIPFCTHDGYGSGISFMEIEKLASEAQVLKGISIEAENVKNSHNKVEQWLKSLKIEKTTAQNTIDKNIVPINISIGNKKLSGYLNNSSTAQEFLKILPQKISMVGFGGREYYGEIDDEIKTVEQGNLNFEDGDITYCPANNTIAIFYAQTSRPNLSMRVIPLGKVTDDLKIFDTLGRHTEISFELTK